MGKFTIEDLRNGNCAVTNDGTLEELKNVLRLAFPNDPTQVIGTYLYYQRSIVKKKEWEGTNGVLHIPAQSVKDFLYQKMEHDTLNKKLFHLVNLHPDAKDTAMELFPEFFKKEYEPIDVYTDDLIGWYNVGKIKKLLSLLFEGKTLEYRNEFYGFPIIIKVSDKHNRMDVTQNGKSVTLDPMVFITRLDGEWYIKLTN